MKKSSKLLLILLSVVCLIIVLFKIVNVKKYTYKLKYDKYNLVIEEVHEHDSYYFEVKINKTVFPFRIKVKKGRKIINSIYYYKDNSFECILPIINNEIKTDMICLSDSTLYDYSYITTKDQKLDDFVSLITNYNLNNYKNTLSNKNTVSGINFYNSNIIKHNVYVSNYKGLVSNVKDNVFFTKDVYDNELSVFVNNYYLTADYNELYEFNEFIIVNLNNNKINRIKSKNSISLDSYIQGIVDDKIYLYDKDNEVQYEIDINNKKINVVSRDNKIKYYENGNWRMLNKPNLNKEIYFEYNLIDSRFNDYDKVIKSDKYYYLLKKYNNMYKLYRADINNYKKIKYITDIADINFKYNDDYIYYIEDEKLIYYSDMTGLKTVLINKELVFNKSIKYYIY